MHDVLADNHDVRRYVRLVLDTILDAVVITETDGRLVFCNSAIEQMFNCSRDALLGQPMQSLFDGSGARATPDDLARAGGHELTARRSDGSSFPLEVSIGRMMQADPPLYVAILRDLTRQKQAHEHVRHIAQHDALTGLPNRQLFLAELRREVKRCGRTDRLLGLMFLDLDRFKDVNDTLGHSYGDALLRDVAARLDNCLRDTDLLARLGGDEFAIIISNMTNVEDAIVVARKVITAISRPFQIDGQEIHTGASIGLTVFPFDDSEPDQLLKNADIALYHAKAEGRGNWQYYDATLNDEVQRRSRIETDLRQALLNGDLALYYQPQFELFTGRMTGAECLLRWRHETKGWISPANFIPIAEACGLIFPLGEWVVREACMTLAAWKKHRRANIQIAVNISLVQFRRENFADFIGQAMDEFGIEPGELELEVTEAAVEDRNLDAVRSVLDELRARGVLISIDDFGTGYSSLNRLKDFPIDKLKIDQSFIREMCTNQTDAAIVRTIINLGHSLNMTVLAEGLESVEQMLMLRNSGCDLAQGYLLARPVPPTIFERYLETVSAVAM